MRESVCRGKYRIPFYLSDSCEKLLRKFLIRDPYKRSGLDLLIDDTWINEGYSDSPISKDLSTKVEEDESIIRLLEAKYHIDRETVLHSLRENLYDDVAANYYLLYYEKESKTNGGTSPSQTTPAGPSGDGQQGPTITTSQSPPQASIREDFPQSAQAAFPPTSIGGSRSAQPSVQPPAASQQQQQQQQQQQDQGMSRITEDGDGDSAGPLPNPTARPLNKAKPRKRRFTVGGEADMQKLADEEEDGAELLKKLNNPVIKEDAVSNVALIPNAGIGISHSPSNLATASVVSSGGT
ncbi:Map microtubule affinity-regulating kinase, partial [Blyttiomyces sp. JEL0837]